MTPDPAAIARHIREAFARTPYPGDHFLQGSFEGCEPGQAVAPFVGVQDWTTLPAALLDAHYDALSFFSEGAFRFFLPAFMTADLASQLNTADPVFHLTGGFHRMSVEVPVKDGSVTRTSGGRTLMNPRRYGAITFEDYARLRLSVFSREECAVIVQYLAYRRERDTTGVDRDAVTAALDAFWTHRAAGAPTTADLERHLEDEQRFLRSL